MKPFVHSELNTTDPAAAKKFYKSLFGWKTKDVKMGAGVYTMLSADGEGFGGLQMKPMPEAPTQWLNYVGVASVKRSMAKAIKLGARPVVEHMDIPGMGAFGVFLDPQGAACAVWQPAKAAPPPRKAAPKKMTKKPAKKAAAKKGKR